MNLDPVLERHAQVEEFRRRHRSGLVTLLFTDIVGSTKLKQNLGDREGLMVIQRHHSLLRELLKQFKDGEEIETAGDSFFIVFATPSDAVKYCLLMQSKLRALSKSAGVKLLDRAGIHVGEVFIEEDDSRGRAAKHLFGIQVDTCARVMSLADGDQILITRFAFDNARQLLKGQDIEGIGAISWLNHGRYVLKGVEEPLEVCEVGEIGGAVLSAPAETEKAQKFVSADSELVLGWRPGSGQVVPNTQWILEEKLGEGGFGEVWLARHETLRKRRAFKFCFRADRVRSLKREVTLFRLLKERVGDHPNIIAVQDVFLDEPPFYLAMEYAEGKDLKSWADAQGGLKKVPMTLRLEIVAQVADALQAAHEAGIIHRDLKPSNILIGYARSTKPATPKVQLTDFGIGQVVSDEVLSEVTRLGFTQTMMIPSGSSQAGTFIYMAPELLSGKSASPRSDIYSLGVVLFQMIVGDLSRPVTPDWADDIADPLLEEDLKHCFARDLEGRFESARELAVNLRSLENRRSAWEKEKSALFARGKQLFWWQDWRQAISGAALTVTLGLGCLISPFDLGLSELSYDFPFALRPEIKPEEAVVVYMDEASHQRLNQPPQGPWDRTLHVKLLRELQSRGASAIVFDILFDRPWTNAVVDQELGTALRKGKAVLAAKLDFTGSENQPLVSRLISPVEALATNAQVGVVELPIDPDGTVRRQHDDINSVGLAWKTAELVGRTPSDGVKRRWINYYGPKGAVPHASYFQALEADALHPDFFTNKVVFVGMAPVVTFAGSTSADERRTPYSRWTGHLSPGVEIQATAYLNLVRRDWLEEMSPVAELLLLSLLGGVLGFGFAMTKPWIAVRAGSLAALMVGAGAYVMFWKLQVWFPWLVVCAVQIPCALSWSVLVNTRRLYRDRELLQRGATAKHPAPQVSEPADRSGAEEVTVASSPPAMSQEAIPNLLDAPTQKEESNAIRGQPAPDNFVPPISDHELVRSIGKGAYGEVWLAKDAIGTYHAVKVVYRKTFHDAAPFEREFRGIQKFTPISRSHPGFVHILHVGKKDAEGYFYYVMEVADDEVSGQVIDPFTYSAKNLAKELAKRGKLSVAECVKLGLSLTEALEHLHQHRLIHRDIKPSNIIFVNGVPKFADIGLVTDLGRSGADMTYVGTHGYIPPEGPGTAEADIYSLGKVLYEVSMGRDRKSFPEFPTTLAERPDREDLLRLNEVIVKACQTDPGQRYKSAAEMHADLARLQ